VLRFYVRLRLRQHVGPGGPPDALAASAMAGLRPAQLPATPSLPADSQPAAESGPWSRGGRRSAAIEEQPPVQPLGAGQHARATYARALCGDSQSPSGKAIRTRSLVPAVPTHPEAGQSRGSGAADGHDHSDCVTVIIDSKAAEELHAATPVHETACLPPLWWDLKAVQSWYSISKQRRLGVSLANHDILQGSLDRAALDAQSPSWRAEAACFVRRYPAEACALAGLFVLWMLSLPVIVLLPGMTVVLLAIKQWRATEWLQGLAARLACRPCSPCW
jgi:hypothetical protein